MRIGISVLTREGHNIWDNGIDQNVYHLAFLLRSLAFVEKVVLLDCGNLGRMPNSAGDIGAQFEVIPLAEADDVVDIAIELSGGLHIEWAARLRARGGKIVHYICGQPYAPFVDSTIFERPAFFSKADRCDEVWLLPKDAAFANMQVAIYRCPVREVPYLWSPVFLEDSIFNSGFENGTFGYKPGSLKAGGAEPAIFEPNLSTIKTGIIPFLICEQIERTDPNLFKKVHFMNSAQLAKHPTFVSLVGNSHLYTKSKVALSYREYFAKIMGLGANIVISHQLYCAQNYLYLDTLYGGYPLIHNSPLFADVGYYYPDSDVEAGVRQVRLALEEHDLNLGFYQQQAKTKMMSLSPENKKNQDIYARSLLTLAAGSKARR